METNVNNFITSMKPCFNYDAVMEPKIREYLLEKQAIGGWTQEEMAGLIGVPKGTLNRWISGASTPDYESMKKIASGLNVEFQELVNAREGRYIPLSQEERDALEINRKYSAASLKTALMTLSDDALLDIVKELKQKFGDLMND